MVSCLDECTVSLSPILRRGWALKGSRPVAKINHSRYRFHIIGVKTKNTFVFSFIVKQNQKTFLRFMKKVVKRFPKLVLFVDNASWHKGKPIKHFFRKRKKTVRVYFFPTYSPELNPVEQHWKMLKNKLGNKCLRSVSTTKYHTNNILKRKDLMPKMFHYFSN